MTTKTAAKPELGTFDGRDVISTSLSVTNAGDGLSAAMTVEPVLLHHGDVVIVVLECEVTKIGFVEIKDTDVLNRVHTLRAGTATIIDRDVVAEALDAQALKIEKAKGIARLPMGDDQTGDE